jgi:hypothetical protein
MKLGIGLLSSVIISATVTGFRFELFSRVNDAATGTKLRLGLLSLVNDAFTGCGFYSNLIFKSMLGFPYSDYYPFDFGFFSITNSRLLIGYFFFCEFEGKIILLF